MNKYYLAIIIVFVLWVVAVAALLVMNKRLSERNKREQEMLTRKFKEAQKRELKKLNLFI